MNKIIVLSLLALGLSGCHTLHYDARHVHTHNVAPGGFVTYDHYRQNHAPKPHSGPVPVYRNYDLNRVYHQRSQPRFGTGNNIGNTCHTRKTC